MCGIFGILRHKLDSIPDNHKIKETARLLRHRGPDNYGFYTEPGLGLVHTRLSLLDLASRSNQPFWDSKRRYCLVYNGEIYNFKDLRTKLEKYGVYFRTTSDTEVLLELLIHCGVEATLPKLEGMFAFALYDKVEKTLILARDRFGIKPLFIYDKNDAFVFASEIQAMRPWVRFEPDNMSISSFLYGFEGPTKGHSFYKNIKFLPPGTFAKVCIGESTQYNRYFSINDFWDQSQAEQLKRLKPQQLVNKVDELMFESVKKQLFADAPVGTLCSGGVDSSLITAMASKLNKNLTIFHANVVGSSSEYEATKQLARHLKLDMKAVDIHKQDFIDLIPEVTEHSGHPFPLMPSSVAFLKVSKLVGSNGVKAILSGEGADECYLGYDFSVPNIFEWLSHPKKVLKKLIKSVIRRRKCWNEYSVSLPKFLKGFSPYSGACSNSVPQACSDLAELIMGLQNRFEVALENEEITTCLKGVNGLMTYHDYMQSLDLLNYHLRTLLHRNDSIGMAASIEARFPFLDSKLVKLAVNIPYNCKIRFSPTTFDKKHYFIRDKWVLRKVAERYLPRQRSQVRKQPFNEGTSPNIRIPPAYFEKSFIADLFGLSLREISHLIDNAQGKLKNKLLHLDVWAQVCLNNVPRETVIKKLRDHINLK